MNADTWGVLAQDPHTVTVLKKRRRVRAYRAHREAIIDRRNIEFFRLAARDARRKRRGTFRGRTL